MTKAEVLAMIKRGEGKTIEFKRSLAGLTDALHSMAAFASLCWLV